MDNKIELIKELVKKLNNYRNSYYNHSISIVPDSEYDKDFDTLQELEKETGFIMSNSPAQTVGYIVQSKLKKVKHKHPMLSLGKTKDYKDICNFVNKGDCLVMLKMDGLTCSIAYDENGDLISAETRGNGEIGEDVLENAKTIKNLPLKINNNGIPLVIDGEVIIDYKDFDNINSELGEDLSFSHTRNAAAGSIRQLDSKIAASRNMKFVAWKNISGINNDNSFNSRLETMIELGFTVVPHMVILNKGIPINELDIKTIVDTMQFAAKSQDFPIDGLVFSYNDVNFGNSLGFTNHHVLSQIALKFKDDEFETVLRKIEWTTGRTGILAPVAIFDEVDLDGALTSRATLHNVSIMKKLKLGIGDTINIIRANQVIPKVESNLTQSNNYEFPTVCPSCGGKLELVKENDTENLYCSNENCPSRMLNKFVHFVSKSAMNIDGLSEATLEKLIGEGFIKSYRDIYHLDRYKNEIMSMDGFGKKSYDKLIKSIEDSKHVKLENYLVALGIDNIGKTASKTIGKYFHGDYNDFELACERGFDFTQLEDFGQVMNDSIYKWFNSGNKNALDYELQNLMYFIFEDGKDAIQNDFINGKVFCVTGGLTKFANREAIIKDIETQGGKFVPSVSVKCNYLINNDSLSNSSKNKKAKTLNIPIITEEEYLNMSKK